MRADEQQADQAWIRWDELATHSEVLYPLFCVSGYIRQSCIESRQVYPGRSVTCPVLD